MRVLKYPHPKLRAFDEEVTDFDAELKQVLAATNLPSLRFPLRLRFSALFVADEEMQ